MRQVDLVIEPRAGWRAPECGEIHLTRSAPFMWNGQVSRVHRVRSGMLHYWAGSYSHASFHAWCGQCLHAGRKHWTFQLGDDPPRQLPICGTCEGRARGAGQLESFLIAGRVVLFCPRGRRESMLRPF